MVEPRRITSRDNPTFKSLLQLALSGRERRRRHATLIEGVHLCSAYLERAAADAPRQVVVEDRALGHPQVRQLLASHASLGGAPLVQLTGALFGELSDVAEGVGIALVIATPAPALPARLADDAVYLDRLQDPGNVGTILRSCAAAGVRRVLTAPHTVHCWSPKVLRAGMGAHFHLAIHEAVPWAEASGRLDVEACATAADAAEVVWDADLVAPRLWVFGHEGGGIAETLAGPVRWLSIPQQSGVESLNVGVAAAVCLFEQARQRRIARRGHRAGAQISC